MTVSGSLIFRTRAALIDRLAEDERLHPHVRLDYAIEANIGHDAIGLGAQTINTSAELTALRPSPHRIDEEFAFLVQITVGSKATIRESEERADELTRCVTATILSDVTLGIEAAGLRWAYPAQFDAVSGVSKDRGPHTLVEILINCKGTVST